LAIYRQKINDPGLNPKSIIGAVMKEFNSAYSGQASNQFVTDTIKKIIENAKV
jgi:hypothetical protein